MYRYCGAGLAGLSAEPAPWGGSVVGGAFFARGEEGDRWEVYICVQAWIIGTIWTGERSASVRLWEGEKVRT